MRCRFIFLLLAVFIAQNVSAQVIEEQIDSLGVITKAPKKEKKVKFYNKIDTSLPYRPRTAIIRSI